MRRSTDGKRRTTRYMLFQHCCRHQETHLSFLETSSTMSLRVWTTWEEGHKLGEALHVSLPRAPLASNSLAQLRESLPQRSMRWSPRQKARLGMGAGCCHKKENTGLMHCEGVRANSIRRSEGSRGGKYGCLKECHSRTS